MSIIYEPSGKAREYSELAANLYTGCSHGCKYCYCPAIIKKTLKEWSENPHARTNIIYQFERDCKNATLEQKGKEVLFSFMSDCYQSDESAFLTRQILLLAEKHQFKKINVLTKAGFRTVNDFDIFKRNLLWKFGSTIIMRNEELREEWEPGAPSIQSRYEAIKLAHKAGIYTWVSIEPVINPQEALNVISDISQFVDFWKIGKLNHMKEVEDTIDWKIFLQDVLISLKGKKYLIKKDLLKYEIHI